MVFPKAVFCRVFQAAFRMALPVLPYRQPPLRKAPASLPETIQKPSASFRERGRGFLGQARKHTPLDNDFRAGYNAF